MIIVIIIHCTRTITASISIIGTSTALVVRHESVVGDVVELVLVVVASGVAVDGDRETKLNGFVSYPLIKTCVC